MVTLAPLAPAVAPTTPPAQSPAAAPAPEQTGIDKPKVIMAEGIPKTAPTAVPVITPAAPPVTPKTAVLKERGNVSCCSRAMAAVVVRPRVSCSVLLTFALSQDAASLAQLLFELRQ
mmetsp:Transcript_50679/g.98032  ORF Transcript_50679/g.98032 Transcript_50679/m.98032 type:complete len:117 (-) Transcript_50679:1015-1365(-)